MVQATIRGAESVGNMPVGDRKPMVRRASTASFAHTARRQRVGSRAARFRRKPAGSMEATGGAPRVRPPRSGAHGRALRRPSDAPAPPCSPLSVGLRSAWLLSDAQQVLNAGSRPSGACGRRLVGVGEAFMLRQMLCRRLAAPRGRQRERMCAACAARL